MGFFDRKPKTSRQDTLRQINFRLLGCVAVGYIAIGMLRNDYGDGGLNPAVRVGVSIAFLAFAIVVGAYSLLQHRRLKKQVDEPKSADDEENEDDQDEEDEEV